jgi:hypothetical protein
MRLRKEVCARDALFLLAMPLAIVCCPKSGRSTLDCGGLTWEVVDGVWRTDGDALIGSGGHIETAAEYADLTIDVTVEEYADAGERSVGIGLRVGVPAYDPRKTNGYEVDWTSRRKMNEFVSMASVSRPLHRTWISLPALQPLKNHLVVTAKGRIVAIVVNGIAVDSFSDDEFAKGHVRLRVESTAQVVRFAQVRITPG